MPLRELLAHQVIQLNCLSLMLAPRKSKNVHFIIIVVITCAVPLALLQTMGSAVSTVADRNGQLSKEQKIITKISIYYLNFTLAAAHLMGIQIDDAI